MIRSLVGGSIILPAILSDLLGADGGSSAGLAPRTPHFAPKAKRVIFLYMTGGVSHLDTFDPKARLLADGGKPVSDTPGAARYLPPGWDFKRGGCVRKHLTTE
jgi:hypothetical protein